MKNSTICRFYPEVFFCILFALLAGCLEAGFELSPESRLPRWLNAPEGVPRSDLKVTMNYYSTFSGGEYVFKLYVKNKIMRLQKISISLEEQPGIRTRELRKSLVKYPNGYPAYNVVVVNGITDIIERRRMEPVFYMTDDPAVWKELGVKQ